MVMLLYVCTTTAMQLENKTAHSMPLHRLVVKNPASCSCVNKSTGANIHVQQALKTMIMIDAGVWYHSCPALEKDTGTLPKLLALRKTKHPHALHPSCTTKSPTGYCTASLTGTATASNNVSVWICSAPNEVQYRKITATDCSVWIYGPFMVVTGQ